VVAGSQMMVTNQPVVHPAETAGDLTQPIGSQETFDDHNQNRVISLRALEHPPQNVATLFYQSPGEALNVLL